MSSKLMYLIEETISCNLAISLTVCSFHYLGLLRKVPPFTYNHVALFYIQKQRGVAQQQFYILKKKTEFDYISFSQPICGQVTKLIFGEPKFLNKGKKSTNICQTI